jgi:mediator of RNA polymerase II transcription subunit 17
MDDNGSIILDPGLTQKPKVVRVRVQEDGRITGTSKLRSLDDITEPSIEDLIRRARDSLFEEELYHEMSLETRILLSYDVKMRDSVIHLPAPTTDGSKRIILIDIIPLDQSLSEIDDHSSELFAQKVAEALRVLLSQIHRQRLYQRSQIPRPLSEQKKQSSPSPILSPLIEYFLGAQAVASVRDYTQQTKASLSSAGINVTTKLKFDGLSQLSQTFKVTATGRSPADHLVRSLTSPRTISVRISLPSSHKYPSDHDFLDIAVRTVVTAPTFGTEYTIFLPQSLAWTLPPQKSANRTFAFMSFTDLMSYFDLLVSLDLSTSVIAKTFSGWKPLEDVPRLRKPPGKPKSGDASSRQPEKLLRITMANKRLQLECVWKGAVERVEKYEWDGSAGVAKKSLEEVVAEWDVKP